MYYIIIFILTFLLTTLLGYLIHWALHQQWSGSFYKAHINHHFKQYPKHNLMSDVYRDAGKDNTTYLFILCFSPLIIGLCVSIFIGLIPLLYGIMMFSEMVIIGLLNNYMHDGFHLNNTIWNHLPGYQRLRELHFIHHFSVQKNLGIFTFMWDKLLGTFRDVE
jgi:sterol desaturase/sphingolipid hydroxylase (fatty acid hydroxylase superfamily)